MNRRNFLLFAGQLGLLTALGCDSLLCHDGKVIIVNPGFSQPDFQVDTSKLEQFIHTNMDAGNEIRFK